MKKYTEKLIEKAKTKPEEIFVFKLNKQMNTFSFSPPINLFEEGKCLLAVTSFEATNSVFNITGENNGFSITTPGHWTSKDCEETINKLNNFLELRSQNDIELHVKEAEKRGTRIEIENSRYNLAGFDLFDSEILAELSRLRSRRYGF